MEKQFDLPTGSVRLVGPNEEFKFDEESIEDLRTEWHDHWEQYKWPLGCVLSIYQRGKRLTQVKRRKYDLASGLWMLGNPRTVTLGIRSTDANVIRWNEANLKKVEWLIHYDLEYDGYRVEHERETKTGIKASDEFRWKLRIRPPTFPR